MAERSRSLPLPPLRRRLFPPPGPARKEGKNVLMEILRSNQKIHALLANFEVKNLHRVLLQAMRTTRRLLSPVPNHTRDHVKKVMEEVLQNKLAENIPRELASSEGAMSVPATLSDTGNTSHEVPIAPTLLFPTPPEDPPPPPPKKRRSLKAGLMFGLGVLSGIGVDTMFLQPSQDEDHIETAMADVVKVSGKDNETEAPRIPDRDYLVSQKNEPDSTEKLFIHKYPGYDRRADLPTVKRFYRWRVHHLMKRVNPDHIKNEPNEFGFWGADKLREINKTVPIPTELEQAVLIGKGENPKQWKLDTILNSVFKEAGIKSPHKRRRQTAIIEYTLASAAANAKDEERKLQINFLPGGSIVEIYDGQIHIQYPNGISRVAQLAPSKNED